MRGGQMELMRRVLETGAGTLSYLRTGGAAERAGLFVHGLGCDGAWFAGHFDRHDLTFMGWLVPDLLGHGDSARPEDAAAYRMESQAQALAEMLSAEGTTEIVIVAHSMGGLVALRLAEILERSAAARVLGLAYAEGNIDENDTFMSRSIAEQSWETFAESGWRKLLADLARDPALTSYLRTLTWAGPLTVHASCVNLVAHSREEVTTALLRRFTFPKLFVFGERNRGRFTSEIIARRFGEVRYIPDAGHVVYEDNPGAFWGLVREFCAAL
jgi:pimeloyl-ACP methyl ester carboxylesterase